ncbi:uncharacterized protein [Aristolochia californica]|uniref:uncharacterized protein isoform X2 n=1 Tax=Aristolochia californica TaxID=171875 RepID=UPI0035D6A889
MASVSAVYIHVVEDVINKVRDEFLGVGVGENVLNELQGLWEMKMIQCGAINGPIERSVAPKGNAGAITPVHDLNVPYEGEEYETPTAEMLFPPTPLQTPIQTPLPGNMEQSLFHMPTPNGPNDYGSAQDTRANAEVKPGRPSPYMQPPSPWMNQRPLGVDVNVAYVEGREEVDRGTPHQPLTQDFFMVSSGKRKRDDYAQQAQPGGYIPQQDGPGDSTSEYFQLQVNQVQNSARSNRVIENGDVGSSQQHGVHNGYDDLFRLPGVANEDYNTPAEHDMHTGDNVATPNPPQNEAAEDEEPPLNEDDDDDDLDDLDQGDDEPDTHHLVLAQFDKVTRTKSRWKCTLKDGIMHINNKDILFTKATGEFDF